MEMENGNIIECIHKRYRVRSPDGTSLELESKKEIQGKTIDELIEEELEEINSINKFFDQWKITVPETTLSELEKSPEEIPLKKKRRRLTSLKEKKIPGIFRRKVKREGKWLDPIDRINFMVKMEGEFTRVDYQNKIFRERKFRMSDFMGHGDIQLAIKLKKIEQVGTTEGVHGLRTYRVINAVELDEESYRRLLSEIKDQEIREKEGKNKEMVIT